jgi:hypothetical protein
MKYLIVFLVLALLAPQTCFGEKTLDEFFNQNDALVALNFLSNDSSAFQSFAYKITDHPKYKKHNKQEKFAKDYDLYIRITGPEINSLRNINYEALYMPPAYYKLYIERYFDFMEYKLEKAEFEVGKRRGMSEDEVYRRETNLLKKEARLKDYLTNQDQWPD